MKEKINKQKVSNVIRRLLPIVAVLFLVVLFFAFTTDSAQAIFFNVLSALKSAINHLIFGIFKFFGLLLTVAALLFDWIIRPENVYKVLDNPAIYESWKMVRDFLNIGFILVLLFSAFCTIFQVEKYHLKKVLLLTVIMALLVNFSFTIARFIIDISNLAFYFILNSMLPGKEGDGILSTFANYSEISNLINPQKDISGDTSTTMLIALCFFTLMLAGSFLIIGILFVVRLAVLGVIIIFSPVGFVGYIFPSTQHLAQSWWSNLFKYSFFAPIAIFMIATSLRIMHYMQDQEVVEAFIKEAAGNVNKESEADFFGSAAFFAIPLVILWTGMIVSQKLSGQAGALVLSASKRFGKKATDWAKKGGKFVLAATGAAGAFKKIKGHYQEHGIPIGGKRYFGKEQKEDWLASKLGGKEVADKLEKEKILKIRKKLKEEGFSDAERDRALANQDKDRATAIAFALESAKKDDGLDASSYEKARKAVGTHPLFQKEFDKSVAKNHAKILIDRDINLSSVPPDAAYKKHLENLSPEEFAKQTVLHKNIASDPHLKNYIMNEVVGDPEYHKEFFKKLTKKLRQEYINQGLHP